MSESDDGAVQEPSDERVSLYPLDPLEALRAALQVDPKSDPVNEDDDADSSRD